ncbi:MAG: hypothetical protein M0D53_00440 [Flavobacterium sp. JAD_PAG50586_2]|nr:MAG: hypothetical protein M0D53_00440 [Flavobacterium sp. JAD_PAG50586_2]
MRNPAENITTLIFIIILSIGLYMYFSEYNVSINLFVLFLILVSISSLCLYFLNYYVKNKRLKVFLSVIIVLFSIGLLVCEVMLASLSSANNVSKTWRINQFEIQSITRSFEGPETSFYELKEMYCFGLIHKDLGIAFPNENNKCVVEFGNANLTFDLCKGQQK